jgi:hypothetical protein
LEFAQLPSSPEYERAVRSVPIRDMSARWRDDLTPAQQHLLDDLLREDLPRYGYPAGDRSGAVGEPAVR